jgi:hypothetical protein
MMTLKSPEFLKQVITTLNEVVSVAETARRLRIDQSTIFIWQRASKAAADAKDSESEFLIEIDGEKKFFHQWCRRAVDNAIENVAANAIVRARDGTKSIARFQGQTVYQLNPDWVDEGLRYLLGLTDADKYLRVNGKLVPEIITVAPSTDLTAFVLGAHLRKRYGKQSSVDVSLNAKVSGGVLFGGGPRAPAIAAPLPLVEVIQDEPERALVDEPMQADDADELDLAVTSTAPDLPPVAIVDDEDYSRPAPAPKAEPEQAIRETSPPELAPPVDPLIRPRTPGKEMSPLEKDLLARLSATLNRAPK